MRTVHVLPADLSAPCRVLRRLFSAGAALIHRLSDTEKVRRPSRYVNAVLLVCTVLVALTMATALTSPASAATLTLRPNGAGSEAALTIGGTTPAATNWESVDEVVADDDATYVGKSSTAPKTDLHALADATGYSGTIDSVTVYVNCAAATTPSGPTAATRILTGGTAHNGSDEVLSTTYAIYSTNYGTNPTSSAAWTWTEIDALEAGVKLIKSAVAQPSKCTQVWVVVTYTPPPVVTVSGETIAPVGVAPGATEVGMLKLNLVTDWSTATWTDVKVDLTGTAADEDISSVEIWSDDGDGIWEGFAGDTEIGAGTFSSGTVTIDIIDQTINTGAQYFYVVFDVAAGANPEATAGVTLVNSSYITVTGPATVSSSGFPLSSSESSLPVELSSFTATDSAGVVILRWTVQSEVDNAWFNLLRSDSRDGEYTRIARIDGRGTSPLPYEYSYTDRDVSSGQDYWYKLVDVSYAGESTEHGPVHALPVAEEAPQDCLLQQNYPNPFNPATVIRYQLPQQGHVSLTIYNTRGQLVRTLVEGKQNAGPGSIRWDGRDETGDYVASGVYLCVLKIGQFHFHTKKMALLR